MAVVPERRVLIKNVRIFNGVDANLLHGSIVIQGAVISKILQGASVEELNHNDFSQVIDGGGRVASPGFIDIHSHPMLCMPIPEFMQSSQWTIALYGAKALKTILSHGFTTIRDAGGSDGSISKAVDEGLVEGPRVFPSAKILSQTCGHVDFFPPNGVDSDNGCHCAKMKHLKGIASVVDGVDAVRLAVRENFKHGATQIKICTSGGVASPLDPIHAVQFSPEEIRAAVLEAEHFGETYVMAHSYTTASVRHSIENGVKCIEHGHLIDDETAKMCAEKNVVVSTQFAIFDALFTGGMDKTIQNKVSLEKAMTFKGKLDSIASLIRKYNIKTGFGTDCFGEMLENQCNEFPIRQKFGFSNLQIMVQATSESASIIEMCNKRNSYKKFGVIEEGALADILLHEENPLDDVSVLASPDTQLRLIMRDGMIFKNNL